MCLYSYSYIQQTKVPSIKNNHKGSPLSALNKNRGDNPLSRPSHSQADNWAGNTTLLDLQ